MPFPRNKVFRGHTIPYGTLAGASKELLKAYYYLNKDSDLQDLPRPPFELEEVVCADDELHQRDIARLVRELLETLPPRQAKVLRLRYGIDCARDYTLEEVGGNFDVTKERIRQIEMNGLKLAKRCGTHIRMLAWLHYN